MKTDRLRRLIRSPRASTIPRSARSMHGSPTKNAPSIRRFPTPMPLPPRACSRRSEGIIPALESAHAIAGLIQRAPKMSKGDLVILNLSGRGDKDMDTYSRLL